MPHLRSIHLRAGSRRDAPQKRGIVRHEKIRNGGCCTGDGSPGAATTGSVGRCVRKQSTSRTAPAHRTDPGSAPWRPAPPRSGLARQTRARPARVSRLEGRPGLAWSRSLAWTSRFWGPTLLVRPALGAAAVLRHDCRGRGPRYSHRRRCRRGCAGSACAGPMLVLGRPLREPGLLGLLRLIFGGESRKNTSCLLIRVASRRLVCRCYGASGDEIASIGGLLTDRWHPSAWILNPPMEAIDAQAGTAAQAA